MIILNTKYEVLQRELNSFVLRSIKYEILVYEDIKDYHVFYNYPLLTFKRDNIGFHHSILEREIKFDDNNNEIKYYCEKGEIDIRDTNCYYIPLIDNGVLVEITRKNYNVSIYIIDLYSIVTYNYCSQDILW